MVVPSYSTCNYIYSQLVDCCPAFVSCWNTAYYEHSIGIHTMKEVVYLHYSKGAAPSSVVSVIIAESLTI